MCRPEARLAASSISNISIKLSEVGLVEPIIKIRDPRTDSSKEGWYSPSLYRENSTLPIGIPYCLAISLAKVVLCVQANIFDSMVVFPIVFCAGCKCRNLFEPA